MSEIQTFTNRSRVTAVVESIDPVRHSAWFGNPPPDSLVPLLAVGDHIVIESYGSMITGWWHNGRWHSRRSDQDIERDRATRRERVERERENELNRHREEWERRTADLPPWLHGRIKVFIDRGGRNFALNGWGYELEICELAALIARVGPDADEVAAYASEQGVSGNQFGVASALAAVHGEGRSLAGTVSGLTPITGDPFYEASS